MKVIIAGSRDLWLWAEEIDKLLTEAGFDCTEVIYGGANGIDQAGYEYAMFFKKKVTSFFPDWATHGKAAGPIRNKEMAKYGDVLLAVWDGKSRGTKNMMDHMYRLKKPVFVHRMDNGSKNP